MPRRLMQIRPSQQNQLSRNAGDRSVQLSSQNGNHLRLDSSHEAREPELRESVQSAAEVSQEPLRQKKIDAPPVRKRPVKLKLSRQLVGILLAYRKAGRAPSEIVETALWKDERISDAAQLLGIPRQ